MSWISGVRIPILGAFLLIAFMALFSSKNRPLFQLDRWLKLPEVPIVEDPCLVPTTKDAPAQPAEGLHCVLKRAATEDSTVVITILNKAWAEPGSLLDLFFESFRIGKGTHHLLKHLVIVAVDRKAYQLCKNVHPHCYFWGVNGKDFSEEKKFMTPDYLDLMWERLDLLRTILDLGYNFVFTDTDVMWLRDPFPYFGNLSVAADIAIACDHYFNPDACSVNGGFYRVKANNKTSLFFRYWHASRERFNKENEHEQHAFNMIKEERFVKELGMKLLGLDTKLFSGFCEHGNDLGEVYTMHANCCGGIDHKTHDLKLVLEDWRNFTSTSSNGGNASAIRWRIPQRC